MGAIGGLLGTAGGASGTGFQVSDPVTGGQLNTAYGGTQGALNSQQSLLNALQGQNGLGNQSQVYGQLQNVASGNGPNPAQAMLNQATSANVANQGALQAGQRGAAQNVGLIARQAGQQGMQAQQAAAGQGATMQANQSLAALGQAGQMANTMAGNQVGQTNANVASQMGEQGQLLGAQQAYNANQAGLAQTGMQGQQGLIGGVLGGAGAALGLADGGSVPDQSAFQGQSKFGKVLAGMSSGMNQASGGTGGSQALQKGMTQLGAGIGKALAGSTPSGGQAVPAAPGVAENDWGSYMGAPQAEGGEVKAMVSPGEHRVPKEKVKDVAEGKVNPLKVGETFPGKPKVKGNSYANDVLPRKLPAGDVIIPNDIMQSKDPVNGAAEFVRKVIANKKGKA